METRKPMPTGDWVRRSGEEFSKSQVKMKCRDVFVFVPMPSECSDNLFI